MESTTATAQPLSDDVATGIESADSEAATETVLIEEELLVEEISIDGMCGVY